MKEIITEFDWEDEFSIIEDVNTNIYINNELQFENVLLDKIEIKRNSAQSLIIKLKCNISFWNTIISRLPKIYDFEIKVEFLDRHISVNYKELIISNAMCIKQNYKFNKESVENIFEARNVKYISNREIEILKEWYGCYNRLNFNGSFIRTTKKINQTIIYQNNNRKAFEIHNKAEKNNRNAFFVKLKDYKFKVSINDTDNEDEIYNKYTIEYRESWGKIPDEDIRYNISIFLSFIIGTKLVKFGESGFYSNYISYKEYIVPSQLDRSLLYQRNFEFYNIDYRRNDTGIVLKQIPKMLNKYFKLKEEYRLNEVLESLYIHSYLNFNFINYVTYIEMFSNINLEKMKIKTIISKGKFKEVVKKLNSVKGIPKKIKDKFPELNTVGIGRKARILLSKYKINYEEYSDVFSVRGKVVHGAEVNIEKMFIASQKAKELLTILTLKQLNYNGYIRNFTNNDELILIKDLSRIRII